LLGRLIGLMERLKVPATIPQHPSS
jgi:hypothetical protein